MPRETGPDIRITAAAVVSLIAGQYFFFRHQPSYATAALLTLASAALFAAAFTIKGRDTVSGAWQLAVKFYKSGARQKRQPPVRQQPERASVAPAQPARLQGKKTTLQVKPLYIYISAALLAGAAQFFFFKHKPAVVPGVLLVLLAVCAAALAFISRSKPLNPTVDAAALPRIAAGTGGTVLLAAGWILLLNQSVAVQELGVILTIPGCILLYFVLPRSDTALLDREGQRNDILFLKPELMNGWVFKVCAVAVAWVLVRAGTGLLAVPERGMYSMIFFGAAGVLIFLAMPLLKFAEAEDDNLVVDAARLAAAVLAGVLAYTGQVYFVKNNVDSAVTYYFFAAIIAVTAFPVHLAKDPDDSAPFPLKAEVVFLVLITLIGFILRIYELDVRPFGLENDEAGGYTARINRYGETTLPLSVGNFGIHVHIVRVFIAIFGELGRMPIKWLGVSVGTLAIPMIYFFIRSCFNPRTAVFATTVFTFLRWNLHYARSGHSAVFSNAVEILAFYFFFRAVTSRKKLMWFLAGLCLGMCLHGVMTMFLLAIPVAAYLLVSGLSKKGYFRANLTGMLAFLLGFWIFGSMIAHNVFLSKRIYFSRVYDVSVFSTDPNAPSKNIAQGIVDNTQKVLLMFNHLGDSRQRNSGGHPLEPTLDFMTSIFFALGFLYALYYSKYWQFFIMVMVFFSQAAGSIFSIEAPSAMRAFGTLLPVMFFIALAFDRVWKSVRRVAGGKWEKFWLPVLLVLALFPIVKENYRQYFQRWIGGLDALSTVSGQYSKQLGEGYRIILNTGLYFPEHPPYRINRWGYKVTSSNRLTACLANLRLVDDENVAIFFHYDTWDNFDSIKAQYFPEARAVSLDQKFFNPKLKEGEGFGLFVKSLEVSNEEVKKARGLNASYSDGTAGRNEVPEFGPQTGHRAPYTVKWSGMLLCPYYAKCSFRGAGNAPFTVTIDGKPAGPGTEIILAEGFHPVIITSVKSAPQDSFSLYMDAKELDGRVMRRSESFRLDGKYLYSFPDDGLHGYYYKGRSWDKDPVAYEVIDANINFAGGMRTETAAWRGTIRIPSAGEYSIFTKSNGYTRVVIDGKYYWEQSGSREASDIAEAYFRGRGLVKEDLFNLSAGSHRIELYTYNSSLVELMWQKSGAEASPVPVGALQPDHVVFYR